MASCVRCAPLHQSATKGCFEAGESGMELVRVARTCKSAAAVAAAAAADAKKKQLL
jgi:hypothetical protein